MTAVIAFENEYYVLHPTERVDEGIHCRIRIFPLKRRTKAKEAGDNKHLIRKPETVAHIGTGFAQCHRVGHGFDGFTRIFSDGLRSEI